MNLMVFDQSLARQCNEELLREVRAQQLGKRLRAESEVGKDEFRKRKEVLSMRRIILVVAVVTIMAASMAFSGSAFASHEHYLLTPGTCVEDTASGQTSKDEGAGGYHKFHNNVHKGQPGMAAFEKENNPVFVDKGSCPTE